MRCPWLDEPISDPLDIDSPEFQQWVATMKRVLTAAQPGVPTQAIPENPEWAPWNCRHCGKESRLGTETKYDPLIQCANCGRGREWKCTECSAFNSVRDRPTKCRVCWHARAS